METSIILFLAGLVGLAVGSFLNVVIHRVPREESIVFPGSRCPTCGASIGALENIPVLSYLVLRGKCRHCGARISWVYPFVELMTAALFVAIAARQGFSLETPLYAIFSASMIALIFIDGRHQLLPNVITYPTFLFSIAAAILLGAFGQNTSPSFGLSILVPGLQSSFSATRAAGLGALLLAGAMPTLWLIDWIDPKLFGRYFEWEDLDEAALEEEEQLTRHHRRWLGVMFALGVSLAIVWAALLLHFAASQPQRCEDAWDGLIRAFWGALIGGGLIWWLRTIYFFLRGAEGMGLGDVKMMCGIGALLGGYGAFTVLLIGSILGALVGVALAARSRSGLKTALPFGVCLGIGALMVVVGSR